MAKIRQETGGAGAGSGSGETKETAIELLDDEDKVKRQALIISLAKQLETAVGKPLSGMRADLVRMRQSELDLKSELARALM